MGKNSSLDFPANRWVNFALGVIAAVVLTLAVLALCAWLFPWEGFWQGAGQPFATVIAGMAALAAGALALYNGERQRSSEADRNRDEVNRWKSEQDAANDRWEKEQKARTTESNRLHDRETVRELRGRFTTATSQLADNSPTIRRSGVYAMGALADDWHAFGKEADCQVCINVLTGYLTDPNETYTEENNEFGAGAGADGYVRETIVRLLSDHRATSWRAMTYDLVQTDLRSVTLTRSDLTAANLNQSYLQHAEMPGVDLTRASLIGAQMNKIVLTNANLTGADLTDANLTYADLEGADLTDVTVSRIMPGITLKAPDGSVLYSGTKTGTDLSHAMLIGAILNNVDLRALNLERARIHDTNLAGMDLSRAQLMGADLDRSTLTRAVLRGTNLSGASLNRAAMQHANLGNSWLTAARLIGADLSNADLRWAKLDKADLSDADLRGANLEGADLTDVIHQDAKWPEGFVPPPSSDPPS